MTRHGTVRRWPNLLGTIAAAAALGACAAEEPAAGSARDGAATLRVPFEANAGQWPGEVAFAARHFAGTLFVTEAGELVHALRGPRTDAGDRGDGFALVERFGNGGEPTARGNDASSARVSYFLGDDPARWQSSVPTFGALSLGDVWPGVEVRLAAREGNVEKLFYVRPGAEVGVIAMELEGPLAHTLADDGRLLVETPHGPIAFSAPVAFQDVHGERRDVPVRYALRERGYGFVVGAYDPRHELVIDPVLQSTYLGGGDNDTPYGAAIADDGSVIVVATTRSEDFPGVGGGAFSEWGGIQGDIVVSRLSADLSTLLQSTYLGGEADDRAAGVLVHDGDVFVYGTSSATDFPTTAGAARNANAGGQDGVIARFNSTLTSLKASTYLGGAGSDEARSMVARGSSLWVSAFVRSQNWPSTAGGAQASWGGGVDLAISRLSTDLASLEGGTYLGGSESEFGGALALAPNGDVLVLGHSTSTNLPGMAGGAQPTPGGNVDLFVSRLSADLETLVQSTYLGGSEYEEARGIAVTADDAVIVMGDVQSDDYPGTAGGAQAAFGGDRDVVLSRLSGDLRTLVQSTYLGTDQWESGFALALDVEGYVLVGGETNSVAYPGTADGPQSTLGGGFDGVITRLDPGLTTVLQSTYLGGEATDAVFALAPAGADIVAALTTQSTDFPNVAGGAQAVARGHGDIAVVRLSGDLREEPLCDDLLHGGPPCAPVFVCGDGVVNVTEECDDDNDESGDGCDEECALEEGYTCSGEPSVCEPEPDEPDEPDDQEAPVDSCACGASGPGGAGGLLTLLGLALLGRARRRRR